MNIGSSIIPGKSECREACNCKFSFCSSISHGYILRFGNCFNLICSIIQMLNFQSFFAESFGKTFQFDGYFNLCILGRLNFIPRLIYY